ncbi:GNAT family N-acetyltransferase [Paenibacillus sp. GCM10027627]|uniref:GNAT family N-acetyltransferase n=1 Tax=unclassified Paenibacillus TaxID=185978 RepID=UPI0036447A84
MITIRTILTHETEPFWNLRLEALKSNPEAFGSTYEDAAAASQETIQSRLTSNENQYVLGAFAEHDQLVGMGGFLRKTNTKERHKSFVWGMYVTPSHRKQGIARLLLQEMINRSFPMEGLEQIQLSVVTSNVDARSLYLSLGFEPFGLEREALKHRGVAYDEEHMVYWVRGKQDDHLD